jgi:hypothetical protein
MEDKMPYTNVPESLWGKMDDCKKKVMDEQGYSEERAIAICHASIVEGKEIKNLIYAEDKPRRSLKERILSAIESIFGATEEEGSAFDAGTVGAVFKQADGRYRWALFSSNAFEDSDREIVSTKALEDDVRHSDAAQQYGPLLWWHVPGAELGRCDFRAVHGHTLVESGLFHLAEVGQKIKESQPHLKASLGFYHPLSEPDGDGSFNVIRTFERSLLPADKAANQLTALPVITRKESSMEEKKLNALKELLGDDLTAQVVKKADEQEKSAKDAGVRFKEQEEPPAEETAPEEISDDTPVTVGMLKEVIAGLREEIQKMYGEMAEPMAEEAKERKAKTDEYGKRLEAAETEIKRLTGRLPKAVKTGFRASASSDTVIEDAKTKELTPAPEVAAFTEFYSNLVQGQRK